VVVITIELLLQVAPVLKHHWPLCPGPPRRNT
jgi:hypothetical protein